MSRILIRNADWVVTVDDDRRVITDGAVEIVDDRIAFVGKSSALAPGPPMTGLPMTGSPMTR